MILAIDFSRVLEDSDHVENGRKLGSPMPGAVKSLRDLKAQGHELIIHTVVPAPVVKEWMNFWGLPYDQIISKPRADLYIDDKALCFTNWDETSHAINAIVDLNGPPTRSQLSSRLDRW